MTRRTVLQASAASGVLAVAPAAALLRRAPEPVPALHPEGTTLESAFQRRGGLGYRRLEHGAPWRALARADLVTPRRGRESRRAGLAALVQISDLHVVDVQHPMRFEYLDRVNSTGHRPQELLTAHGTAALVRRINTMTGGPFTGRPLDAVISTGDNTDNQSGTELTWLLTLLAGGVVRPDSGAADGFEGVAASGLTEYWQPDNPAMDRYKAAGFPHLPGLIAAATRPVSSPGLAVPWLLTMGNHDVVANGMLENRGYVEDWSGGGRKIFSARGDATYRLAALLRDVRAGDDVGELLEAVARGGMTRSVHADERRLPYDGGEFASLLREPQFTGAGPVGHGYEAGAGGDRLYYSYPAAPGVTVISLDSTNQAGGIDGSIGAGQWAWLVAELERLRDQYVLVFSHHPSHTMENLAPDPRTPGEQRHSGRELITLLQQYPQVLAWVNGHMHHNAITPRRHPDPRRSFWEINSASHLDAPQQARVIELARNGDGTVSLFTTMVDADAPAAAEYGRFDDAALASLYRELAYNDPAFKDRAGRPGDRNTELLLTDPLPA